MRYFISIKEAEIVIREKLFNLLTTTIQVGTTPQRAMSVHITQNNKRFGELVDKFIQRVLINIYGRREV
jgi:hypothetical protein